jgi:glycosyltransferase involved in cell wall biosynthesis
VRRIVHYYPAAMAHSGVTFALWSWARVQAASGAEVCVLHAGSTDSGGSIGFVSQEYYPGLSDHGVPHRGRYRMTLRPVDLDRYLGRNDLLVLHEGWVSSNLVAAAAARRAGVPYVVMPHGVYESKWTTYLKPPRWLRNQLERQLLERAAAVHVFFDSEIADIAALAPSATFVTVPTGLDVPDEQWTGGGGYLGWIGRVDPFHKGLDALAGAVARLSPDHRPTIRLRGYDYEGGLARLRHLIAGHGVARWVRLEEAIAGARKTQFLQQADGYVHPSRWDSHSMALLENLALGVPCIVSSTIHIAQTLARSSAAVLARPSEIELASALWQENADRCRMSRRARALVGHAFNWTALMPRFHAAMGRLGLQ